MCVCGGGGGICGYMGCVGVDLLVYWLCGCAFVGVWMLMVAAREQFGEGEEGAGEV